MNLHIPDVRILEVHTAPWSNTHHLCQPSSILEERNTWDFRSCCTPWRTQRIWATTF